MRSVLTVRGCLSWSWWRRHAPAALTVAVGLTLSVTAFSLVRWREKADVGARLNYDIEKTPSRVRVALLHYVETLGALGELLPCDRQVTGAEFERVAVSALAHHRAYRALAFVRFGAGGAAATTGRPDEPELLYLVPDSVLQTPLETSLGPDAPLGQAVRQAAAGGATVMSAPLPWADQISPSVVAVAAPLCRSAAHPADPAAGHQATRGVLVGLLDVTVLIDEVLPESRSSATLLEIHDVTESGRAPVVYRRPDAPLAEGDVLAAAAAHGNGRRQAALTVAGRRWQVTFDTPPTFMGFDSPWEPLVTLLGGLALSVLLTKFVTGRSARIEALVRQRTAELAAVNERLASEIAEREQAQRLLARNLDQQTRLNRLFQDELTRFVGLESKLKCITTAVVEVFGADFCRIWVTAPGDRCDSGCMHARVTEGPHVCRQRDRCLHLLASSGRYTHTDGEVHRRVPFGCYKIGRVAAGNDPKFLTNDVPNDPRVHNHQWARELGLVSFAGYRLTATDGAPIGVLALFAQRAIMPEEDRLLESVAGAVSHIIQVERAAADLETRVQKRTAELAQLNRELQIEIAERIQAERALRESEQRYRRLFDDLNDAAFVADIETGVIVEANRQAEVLLGRPRAEIVGMHQSALHPPDKSEEYRQRFADHVIRGKAGDYDGEIVRKDGSVVPVHISATPVSWSGRPALLGLFQDTSDRRRAEEQSQLFARQQSAVNALLRIGLADAPLDEVLERCLDEILFNTWLEPAPRGAIFLVDDDPQVLVLHAARNLPDEVDRSCRQVPLGRCLCGRAAAERQTVFARQLDGRHEMRCSSMGGYPHYCVPICSGGGVAGVLVVYFNAGHQPSVAEQDFLEAVAGALAGIIDRRRIDQRLRDSEERYRTITQAAQDAIITADANGIIRFWNPAAERIFGYSAEEAVGRDMTELIVPARYHEAKRRGMAVFARTGCGAALGKTLELSGSRKDGSEFPIQISVSAYQDRRGYVAVAVIRDITVRKQAEARLEQAHRELVELSRRAGMAEVATGVLHNVGNVLNSLNVSAGLAAQRVRDCQVANLVRAVQLLREHEADLSEFLTRDERGRRLPQFLCSLVDHLLKQQAQAAQELEALLTGLEHLKNIIGMQQSYAGVAGVAEVVNLPDVLEDALRLNGSAFERHAIRVERDYQPIPPVRLDKHRLLQILVNLLRNAKYALSDSGKADKCLTLRLRTVAPERIRIEVCDNGIGIPPENLTRIFAHGFTTRKDGHGFGLHSSALAAKEMGGTLTVHSDGPGQGATFAVELPLVAAQPAGTEALEVTL